ncbi:ribonuclease HII [Campylobacter upsaliensis]|uniref:ribonuclease HII n=1 Tax=Campylobacter upsaliensis TaxID=28080 RepID=UPI00127F7B8F|nr:ribonuclease HII [Campylobacter upsaliensis]EAH7701725.1 ribonuclease HII [Campylobacter upsaliensis]EAH9987152.1 ribonuclease HII [Campylobacter upsaliensis]EAI4330106.1 ribonuclease HII [Campylobacter upsaliensis]EAI5601752.1 ribonuclease HII [Campylobacter upsaliensis]EAI6142687.1 ribonuclease HII [Campylobacter upsaliensis]
MLVGIDEAGRGALAGPLFMAACELLKPLNELKDSKKLSEKKREKLYNEIILNSNYLILAFSNAQIDTLGLSKCLQRGLEIIHLHFEKQRKIFDGNTNYGVLRIENLIKADSLIAEVSAASILAKVSRDKVMQFLALKYPQYGFEIHKAYGTKAHRESIAKYGACKLHRLSFKLT